MAVLALGLACNPTAAKKKPGAETVEEAPEVNPPAEIPGQVVGVLTGLTKGEYDVQVEPGVWRCDHDPGLPFGRGDGAQGVEQYEVASSSLTVTDENGRREYVHQGDGVFCRDRSQGYRECHADFEADGYRYVLYDDTGETCFSAEHHLQRVGAAGSAGEGPAGDQEAGACVAGAEECAWEFFGVTFEEGSRGTRCLGNFHLRSLSERTVMVYAYKEASTGSEGDQYAGYGAGAIVLAPGEAREENINRTVYDDGDETYQQITRILVITDDPGCRWMDPRTAAEGQFEPYFVAIPDPCLRGD